MLMSMIHADVCCYGQGIFICSGIDHCISIIVNERPWWFLWQSPAKRNSAVRKLFKIAFWQFWERCWSITIVQGFWKVVGGALIFFKWFDHLEFDHAPKSVGATQIGLGVFVCLFVYLFEEEVTGVRRWT